jgi:uncharacterized protein (DUF2141 family)
MNTFLVTLFLSFTLLTMAHYRSPKGQEIPVMVTGLQSGKGQIILDVFKDKDSYKDQKPFKQLIFDKTSVKDGYLTVSINLEEGTYGITLVDTPTGGLGFSNFYRKKMKWPAFDDIKIVVKNENDIFDGTTPVDIRVKYIPTLDAARKIQN